MITRKQQQERWVLESYQAIRNAVGWQLKMRYEPPLELTPELISLVAAIDEPRVFGRALTLIVIGVPRKLVIADPTGGIQSVGADRPLSFMDEAMTTLRSPQVMLAWLMNDAPIPPKHGAPLRLIVPFRYGNRSIKAITEIAFGTPSLPMPPLPA